MLNHKIQLSERKSSQERRNNEANRGIQVRDIIERKTLRAQERRVWCARLERQELTDRLIVSVCVCECEHKRLLPFVKNKYTWETPKGENLRLAAWGAFLLLFMCFYDSISLSLSYPQPISNNFVYVCVFPCQKSRQQAHKSAPLKRGKLHHWATFLFLRRISRAFVLCAKSKCVY